MSVEKMALKISTSDADARVTTTLPVFQTVKLQKKNKVSLVLSSGIEFASFLLISKHTLTQFIQNKHFMIAQ